MTGPTAIPATRTALIAALEEAEAEIDRGECITLDEAGLRALCEGVKRRGRERLATQRRETSL